MRSVLVLSMDGIKLDLDVSYHTLELRILAMSMRTDARCDKSAIIKVSTGRRPQPHQECLA